MNDAAASQVLLYGTDEARPQWRTLAVEGTEVEVSDRGFVGRVFVDGGELVRGVQFLLRDAAWNTPPLAIREYAATGDGGSASATWAGHIACDGGEVRFELSVWLEAWLLRVGVQAVTTGSVLVNRVGFVVLHPAKLAGSGLRVIHADGAEETTIFPKLVAPHQPAFDIREMRYGTAVGSAVTIAFEGDVFEMEDQRNWTDDSYKTYSRPLALPRPFELRPGISLRQSVTFKFDPPTDRRIRAARHTDETTIDLDGLSGALPAFGLFVRQCELHELGRHVRQIEGAAPSHLFCDIGSGRSEDLAAAARLAAGVPQAQLGLRVKLAGHDPLPALDAFAEGCRRAGLTPARIALDVSDTTAPASVYAAAGSHFPHATVGAAFDAFVHFNRNRQSATGAAFILHGTSATVHDAEDRAVMGTCDALPDVFATVRALAPGIAYHAGPVQIGQGDGTRQAGTNADPRSGALFGAAWNVRYAAAAAGGVKAVSFAPALGGLLARDGSPLPAFHTLTVLFRASSMMAIRLVSSAPDTICGIAWREIGGTAAFVCNVKPHARSVLLGQSLDGTLVRRLSSLADGPSLPSDKMLSSSQRVLLPPFASILLWKSN